jgi:peptide/nickel transport system substrate-binding protein
LRHRLLAVCLLLCSVSGFGQTGGELRICIRQEPKTFNPLLVNEDASETVRYLTGGVLVRVNRVTQQPTPEIAKAWKVSPDGKRIIFVLRSGLKFSDGTPFSADDVVYTMTQMMDPELHSATGDAFRSAEGKVLAKAIDTNTVQIDFPAPVAGLAKQFDQVAIMSAKSSKKEMAVLGPFYVADRQPGSYILLKKNPNYWRKPLPSLDSVRLDIQANRETEALRFRRGEIHLINSLPADLFEKMSVDPKSGVRDVGVSTDTEQFWFNQVPNAPIPAYKRAWFVSGNFRRAVSAAINRADLARVVFRGHASPAIGPVSPASKFWFNSKLKPYSYDLNAAGQMLAQDGFKLEGGDLKDKNGNLVEFSIVTNSGNREREKMAALIQQDLKQIGIKVNIVTLDFPSLIERITGSFNYEAAMLGLQNVDPDPNGQMSVWLSSSSMHQWNPSQKLPATTWEAEIDRFMRLQASSVDDRKRKAAWDHVQEIVMREMPFMYLVNKNAFVAISPKVQNAKPSVFRPQTYWNIAELQLGQ